MAQRFHSLYNQAGTVYGFDNLFDSDILDRQNAEEVNVMSEDTLTAGNRVYMNCSITDEEVKQVITKLKRNKSAGVRCIHNIQSHYHSQAVSHFLNSMLFLTKGNTSNNTCINHIHQSKNIKAAYHCETSLGPKP